VGGGIQEATRRMRERKGQPGSTRVGTPAAGGGVASRPPPWPRARRRRLSSSREGRGDGRRAAAARRGARGRRRRRRPCGRRDNEGLREESEREVFSFFLSGGAEKDMDSGRKWKLSIYSFVRIATRSLTKPIFTEGNR